MYRTVLLTLVCVSASVSATAEWLYARSDHFDIYTDTDERLAKTTLETFEQLRDFFLTSRKLALEPVPVTVVLFRRNIDYREYAPPLAAAFYSPGHSRDFIVMSAPVAGNAEVAAHELTHLLWQRSGRASSLPPWLSEGLAEVYSTVRPVQGHVRVGATPERSRQALAGRWLPLRYLLTTELLATDPAARHQEAGALFYAQSWLLTHMLMFHPDYGSQFGQVVQQISQRQDSATVLTNVYGKPLPVVEKDLYAYGDTSIRKKFAEFDTPLRSVSVKDPAPAEAAAVDVVLALLETRTRPKQAEQTLLRKSEQKSGCLIYLAGLSELYWLNGDLDGAHAYARKIVASEGVTPDVLWLLGRLSQARGEPRSRTILMLEKVLADEPQHISARLMLATLLLEPSDAGRAIQTLSAAPDVSASVRGRYHAIKACAHALLGQQSDAEAEISSALKHPRTPAEDELLSRARQAVPATH